MAATELSRNQLKQEFRDGERPSGEDFESAWLSCLNKIDDNIKPDANGNLELGFLGIKIKDTPAGTAGTLRFNSGQIQFHDGVSFKSLSSGASGAFVQVGAGTDVGFSAGNVGINTGLVVPTHRLEVNIGPNTGTTQRVKLGNLAVHNGAAGTAAVICNSAVAGNAAQFALSQDGLGQTTLNSATDLFLNQNATNRLMIFSSGNVQIAPVATLTITGNTIIGSNVLPALNKNLNVNGNLVVTGDAQKTVAGPFGGIASDARVKKDVRPYLNGLEQVLAFKPVTFKFNGKATTPDDGKDYIGFIAQDIQKVAPELVFSRALKFEETDEKETDILNYDLGPVTFMLINAIKELNARLVNLEKKKPK
jgi:Chaperone of endosialidase